MPVASRGGEIDGAARSGTACRFRSPDYVLKYTAPVTLHGSAAVQHKYLQTKFFIVLIGFSELPALSWRSAVFRSAATLGSFFFDGCSAITMAQ
jgi:hypothetical protein